MQCTVHSHTHCYFFCRSNVTFIGHANLLHPNPISLPYMPTLETSTIWISRSLPIGEPPKAWMPVGPSVQPPGIWRDDFPSERNLHGPGIFPWRTVRLNNQRLGIFQLFDHNQLQVLPFFFSSLISFSDWTRVELWIFFFNIRCRSPCWWVETQVCWSCLKHCWRNTGLTKGHPQGPSHTSTSPSEVGLWISDLGREGNWWPVLLGWWSPKKDGTWMNGWCLNMGCNGKMAISIEECGASAMELGVP